VPRADIGAAPERRIAALQDAYPGVGPEQRSGTWRVVIPDGLRLGHDARFIQLTRQFLYYVEHPRSLPAWERQHAHKVLRLYRGVAMSRRES